MYFHFRFSIKVQNNKNSSIHVTANNIEFKIVRLVKYDVWKDEKSDAHETEKRKEEQAHEKTR